MTIRRTLRHLSLAAALALALTALVAAPAEAFNTGIVQGTVTRAGAAVSTGEQIALRGYVGSDTFPSTVRFANPDASGFYQFTQIEPGKYTIEFGDQTPGSHYANQFYPTVDYFEQASTFMIANGDVKTANAQLRLGGSVSFAVVQGTNQIPSVNASVTLLSETSPGTHLNLFTDSNGEVSWPQLTVGTWAVQISQSGFNQEYYNNWQSEALSKPDWLVVTAGSDSGTLPIWVRSSVQPSTTYFQDVPSTSSFFTAIDFMATHKISTGTPSSPPRYSASPGRSAEPPVSTTLAIRISGPGICSA